MTTQATSGQQAPGNNTEVSPWEQLREMKKQRNRLIEQINKMEKASRRTPRGEKRRRPLSEPQQAGVRDRRTFIAYCMMQNEQWKQQNPRFLLEYYRERDRTKSGVVVLFKRDNTLQIGFSKCDTTREQFDTDIALWKAIRNAQPVESFNLIEREIETPLNIDRKTNQLVSTQRVLCYKAGYQWVPHSLTHLVRKFLDVAPRYFKEPEQSQTEQTQAVQA